MTTQDVMVGPLTGNEWALLTLGDDPRNPLPPCCGNISDVRDQLLHVFRSGGDPATCWPTVAMAWPAIEACCDEPGGPLSDPILAKLHAFYLTGRDLNDDFDLADAKQRMMGRTFDEVKPFLALLDDPQECPWDLTTREGWTAALARIGSAFVAYVRDPDERMRAADEIRAHFGLSDHEMGSIIDVLRAREGLPYDPTHRDHREP